MDEPGSLVLSGIPTPAPPRIRNGRTIACRPSTKTVAWVEEQAEREGISVNRFLINVLEQRRHAGPAVPADVMYWLRATAASCGRPGDWELALTTVVRDLAKTYPEGIRLPVDQPEPERHPGRWGAAPAEVMEAHMAMMRSRQAKPGGIRKR